MERPRAVMMPNRPRSRAPVATVLLAAGLLAWTICAVSLDNGHVGVVHDDGIYLASARALHDGLTYDLPTRPGRPRPKYPPGLPALIAGALSIAPGKPSLPHDIAVARTVVIVSANIFFVAAYFWLRRLHVNAATATLIVLATAFNHVALVGGATTIFADLPFCAVVYLLFARWARGGQSPRPLRRAFADGTLAGLGFLLRSNGITLIAAALLAAGLGPKKRIAAAACAIGLIAVVVPLQLLVPRTVHPVPSGDYALELRAGWSSPEAGLRIVAENLGSLVWDFPLHVIFPNAAYTTIVQRVFASTPIVGATTRLLILLPVAFGIVTLGRRSRRADAPAWLHIVGTLAIFAVWPWNSVMDRFLLSLFPIVLLCFAVGAGELVRLMSRQRRLSRRVASVLLAVGLGSNASVAARAVMQFHSSGRQWPGASDRAELTSALAFVNTLEPDAVIAANWPETVALYTGRQAVPLIEDDQLMLRASGNSARLKRWFDLVPDRPCYLLVRSPAENPSASDQHQADHLAADPRYRLHDVFRSPGGRYRVIAVDRVDGPDPA